MAVPTGVTAPTPPDTIWHWVGGNPATQAELDTAKANITPSRDFTAGEVLGDGIGGPGLHWTAAKGWLNGVMPYPIVSVAPGQPGLWTDGGGGTRGKPADMAELQSLGALGQTTAWPPGTYAGLSSGSTVHWDGAAWHLGVSRVGGPADFTSMIGDGTALGDQATDGNNARERLENPVVGTPGAQPPFGFGLTLQDGDFYVLNGVTYDYDSSVGAFLPRPAPPGPGLYIGTAPVQNMTYGGARITAIYQGSTRLV